jgi:hypothetical protein
MTMNADATISVTGTGSSGNSPAGVNVTVDNYERARGRRFTIGDSQILANSPPPPRPIAVSAELQMTSTAWSIESGLSGIPNQPPGGGVRSRCSPRAGSRSSTRAR